MNCGQSLALLAACRWIQVIVKHNQSIVLNLEVPSGCITKVMQELLVFWPTPIHWQCILTHCRGGAATGGLVQWSAHVDEVCNICRFCSRCLPIEFLFCQLREIVLLTFLVLKSTLDGSVIWRACKVGEYSDLIHTMTNFLYFINNQSTWLRVITLKNDRCISWLPIVALVSTRVHQL